MAENEFHEHRETRRSGGSLAFIVGGLVVAVGLILYWLFGGMDATPVAGEGSNIEINATSDSAAGATDDAATTGAAATADSNGAASESGAAATTGADTN